MFRSIYRYVFRGIGILMLIGMITILFLAISSQSRCFLRKPAAPIQHGR